MDGERRSMNKMLNEIFDTIHCWFGGKRMMMDDNVEYYILDLERTGCLSVIKDVMILFGLVFGMGFGIFIFICCLKGLLRYFG